MFPYDFLYFSMCSDVCGFDLNRIVVYRGAEWIEDTCSLRLRHLQRGLQVRMVSPNPENNRATIGGNNLGDVWLLS